MDGADLHAAAARDAEFGHDGGVAFFDLDRLHGAAPNAFEAVLALGVGGENRISLVHGSVLKFGVLLREELAVQDVDQRFLAHVAVGGLIDDDVRSLGADSRAAAAGEQHVGLQIVRLQEILDHAQVFLVSAGKAAAAHTNDDLAFHEHGSDCAVGSVCGGMNRLENERIVRAARRVRYFFIEI